MNNTLSILYNDRDFQQFLEEIFMYNGTFNIEYNVNVKIDYLKQTTYGFKSTGVIDYVTELESQFKLQDNVDEYVEGNKVYAFLDTISFLESKTSNKLNKLVSSFKLQEAIPVLLKTVKEPRMMIINRLKQNKYFTVSKLFSYRYLYQLLSPFFDVDISMFRKQYNVDVDVNTTIQTLRNLRNMTFDDKLVWLDDLSYNTISEITRYYRLIEKVLYEKQFSTITKFSDIVVLYLNWLDMKNRVDKSQSLEYVKSILHLRNKFPYGYISTRRFLSVLSDLYIDVRLELRDKQMRTIVNKNFVSNLLKYKLVTEENLSNCLINSLASELVQEALQLLGSEEHVVKVVDKFRFKDPTIYQKMYKAVLKI